MSSNSSRMVNTKTSDGNQQKQVVDVRFVRDEDVHEVIKPISQQKKKRSKDDNDSHTVPETGIENNKRISSTASNINIRIKLGEGSTVQRTPDKNCIRRGAGGTEENSVLLSPVVKLEKLNSSCDNTPSSAPVNPKTSRRKTNRNVLLSPDAECEKLNSNCKDAPSSAPVTPKTSRRMTNLRTPATVRSLVKRELAKRKEAVWDDDDDLFEDSSDEWLPDHSSSSESDSAENSDNDAGKLSSGSEDCETVSLKKMSDTLKKSAKLSESKMDSLVDGVASSYKFDSQYYFSKKAEKSHTSSHTLSTLRGPKLDRSEMNQLLNACRSNHSVEKQMLINKYRTRFNRWLYYLKEGFTLLLYGVGSKRDLLNQFRTECLSRSPVIVINGFFPGLTIKEILYTVMVDILKQKYTGSNTDDCLRCIKAKMKSSKAVPLFILVHNIDGVALRAYQRVLAKLASIPNVHMIASFDHINAPLLWSSSLAALFNFLWINTTTYQQYEVETSFESSLLTENSSSSTTLSSLTKVFIHLPSNTKKILKLIIKDHLDNHSNKSYEGVSFSDLYSWSREAMVATSDLVLRTQLTEFMDHHIIKWKKDSDIISLCVPSHILRQFYEAQFKEDDEF